MSLIGVSTLELCHLIEQAFLPERCIVSCLDGEHLTLQLGQGDTLGECLTVTGIHVHSLTTCHELAALVAQVREEQRLGRSHIPLTPQAMV
ncbi:MULTISPECIES: DUF1652 domain-containing protein [Pseudomonas]|uniref:DUF1652 domain-containing protein n=1 Tax=Pseudomonas donghuensis TaxID=1163398 RepID=A0AAP0SKG3_9PSED|nr:MULTISPECIES: DUF1652 domain-containing protein [Pseudomonas]MDF9894004.1 hypothetical protein [Pseudomonas vranovensis]KDO00435.1 DUF1652 domain-containing protein [Pseudomonas donghuensis]MBF4210683.1 DUF1652 domain-containing protein [Pseudomonas donghuensis]MCP6693763.1 DUF1652 domain-containing protein [Pseudomonas donghuensis]MCP6697485.1 DUF1652 domain-containing protein [Pseudomonas donghuensis]